VVHHPEPSNAVLPRGARVRMTKTSFPHPVRSSAFQRPSPRNQFPSRLTMHPISSRHRLHPESLSTSFTAANFNLSGSIQSQPNRRINRTSYNSDSTVLNAQITTVPEPSAFLLATFGILAISGHRRKVRNGIS